jgi:hypothetical protein
MGFRQKRTDTISESGRVGKPGNSAANSVDLLMAAGFSRTNVLHFYPAAR